MSFADFTLTVLGLCFLGIGLVPVPSAQRRTAPPPATPERLDARPVRIPAPTGGGRRG